ncbi:MAG: hypothetical protein ISR59_04395 [Anaerolineales bacterium]|uniref:SH3 domain-containing protein n=1 Tax=Candidatus Desulfolinea nitratireducens TaxID=2841698 RepID=A0A8J6NLB7_9CHLR|nr:hypothetical protein [Candidatus Desulfolinea nitratireducens]MBL6960326.1 hypothetical protein [Anaerolineales bacterium]
MISKKQILFVFSLILATTLACILEGGSNLAPPALPTNDVIATAVEMTLRASGQFQPPPAPLPSPLPEATLPPPTAVFTPTVTLTPTPAIPMVSVSLDTNCRTGPGKIYDYLGALLVGEKAEIVGKNTTSNYWIIKNPDASGNCWLWGFYATVEGNTSNLPEIAVPPTPTPALPKNPKNFNISKACVPLVLPQFQLTAILSWVDNSDNEDGFYIYQNGVLLQTLGADTTQVALSFPVAAGVPMEYGVEAYNAAGSSARKTESVICP